MREFFVVEAASNRIYDGHGGNLPPHKARFYADIRNSTILDVGCGAGQAAVFLAPSGNVLDGLTWSEEEARLAGQHYRDLKVVDLNVATSLQLIKERYDVILLGDVLEHLADPAALIAVLRNRLEPGGRMYISVPNVANVVVRLGLLFGKFDYTEDGILDSTHLRFFTLASLRRFLRQTGLVPLRYEWSCWNWNLLPARLLRLLHAKPLHDTFKSRLTAVMPGLLATQLMVVARVGLPESAEPGV